MAIGEKKQTCFVIMPFGDKKDADGQDIDFDDIYRFFFRKAIESLGLECIRCDEIAEAGSIHEKMFEQINQADVAVVDITTANPNVFYELGIRHTLHKAVTVLIRRKGTALPFNIQGLQVVEYDQKKFASIERAKERICEIIKHGLETKKNDSPVHAVLELNIRTDPKPILETKEYEYRLINSSKAICLVTGDIQNVKGIDLWVNPENIHMQMARPMEPSISGVIRYLGSEKKDGKVRDTIAQALAAAMGDDTSVEPAKVLVTTAGNLERSHKVKKILHVAAVIGQVGKGYFPIPDVPRCVTNALEMVDTLPETDLHTILFPLMGARSAQRDFEQRLDELLEAAIVYLNQNPGSKIEKVYFLTYSDSELEACQDLLKTKPYLVPATGAVLASPSRAQTGLGSSGSPPGLPQAGIPGGAQTASGARVPPAGGNEAPLPRADRGRQAKTP